MIAAPDGPDALAAIDAEGPAIDLLFTDIVLPGGMSGADVARAAHDRLPHLRTLFASGYARNAIMHHGRLDPGVDLLVKPFSYADLAAKVRDVLDRPEPAERQDA